VLHLRHEDARSSLRKFGTDLNLMAMCLTFRNDKLSLRNPKNLFTLRQASTPVNFEATNIMIDPKIYNETTDRKQRTEQGPRLNKAKFYGRETGVNENEISADSHSNRKQM